MRKVLVRIIWFTVRAGEIRWACRALFMCPLFALKRALQPCFPRLGIGEKVSTNQTRLFFILITAFWLWSFGTWLYQSLPFVLCSGWCLSFFFGCSLAVFLFLENCPSWWSSQDGDRFCFPCPVEFTVQFWRWRQGFDQTICWTMCYICKKNL